LNQHSFASDNYAGVHPDVLAAIGAALGCLVIPMFVVGWVGILACAPLWATERG